VHPTALFADMWRTLSSGASWRGEMCNRAKDGSLHWLDTTIVPVCTAEGVPERYVSIRYDLTEQKALEAHTARAARIREGISQVQSAFIASGLGDAMREALALTLDASESGYGFIGEVLHEDGTPWLRTHAITDDAWNEDTRALFARQQAEGLEFRNLASLFGAALVTGEPVIANNVASDPRAGGQLPGHPPLRAFLGMPIHIHGELVAMVGIGNGAHAYGTETIAILQAVLDAVGQLVRSARERSARAAAEAALLLERQRLADVIQGTGVGIWSWDLQTDGVWFNDRWSTILGYPREALAKWRASDWFDGYHPDDLETAERDTRATFDGAADGIDVEVRMRHAEGHWVWLHLRGSVSSRDAAGKPCVLSGMAQDITERKHGERMRALINEQLGAAKEHAVRKSQEESVLAELLRLGLSDSDIPSFLKDALATTLTSIDWLRGTPGACITLRPGDDGMPAPEAIHWRAPFVAQPAEPAYHALPLRDGDRTLGELHVVFAEGEPPQGDARLFLERVAAVLVTGVRHRDAARRLRDAAVAAESASIAKSQFLATMSHEIRTPMNGVLGTLDLLLGTPLEDGQREWATTAHDSAQQLLQLLNEILDFSRLEASQVKLEQLPLAPGDLLQRVLSLLLAQAREKGTRIARHVDAGTPAWVLGDATRLQQVLMNLVGNAVKFTDRGEVGIDVRHDGTHLRVEVHDTGIGIATDAQARLFNRFVQADSSITRRFGGTGLGLAICSQLVRAMGGEIGVHSRPGEGSLFWFSVPAPACDGPLALPSSEDSTGSARTAPTASPLRVLVAEDNPVNQRIMRAFLEGAGHHVTVVDDGAQAVAAHTRAPYDIVLMDVQMPVMDGLSATTALRALPGDAGAVPIIAITANAMPGDRERYLTVGMDGYVSKPINRVSLAESIAAAMQVSSGHAGT
jgi:PAS domain S-box-containing protein